MLLLHLMSERFEDIRAIWNAAREDHQDASLRDKATFYATSLGLVAHQLGMEAALFAVGSSTYLTVHQEMIGGNVAAAIAAPLATGAAMGLFSLTTETLLTEGTSRGLDTFNAATTEIADRYIIPDEVDEATDESLEQLRTAGRSLKDKGDTVLIAVGLGSAATVVLDYGKHPDEPTENHRQLGLRVARALGAVNVGLGLGIGTAVSVSEAAGTEAVFNGLESVADSPITYGVIAGLIGVRALFAAAKHRRKRIARDAASEQQD